MTIKEALAAVVGFTTEDNILDKALIDNDLTGATAYSSSVSVEVDSAAVDALFAMLSAPDISEGGYSIKYDRDAIKSKLLILAERCDRDDVINQLVPTVSASSPW